MALIIWGRNLEKGRLINCTASIGGFVGPKIIGEFSQRTGSFNPGFIVMIACWTIRLSAAPALPAGTDALNWEPPIEILVGAYPKPQPLITVAKSDSANISCNAD